jgi:hypothetical protein
MSYELNFDCWEIICHYLDPPTFYNIKRVNRYFREMKAVVAERLLKTMKRDTEFEQLFIMTNGWYHGIQCWDLAKTRISSCTRTRCKYWFGFKCMLSVDKYTIHMINYTKQGNRRYAELDMEKSALHIISEIYDNGLIQNSISNYIKLKRLERL